jgi:hypothetical protein
MGSATIGPLSRMCLEPPTRKHLVHFPFSLIHRENYTNGCPLICRQWGNLLTLAAVYKDPTLGKHVDQTLLKELFAKTITFFRMTAQPSSALFTDMRILEGIERQLWGRNSNIVELDPRVNTSFSSGSSHAPPPFHPLPSMASPGPPPPPPRSTSTIANPGTPADTEYPS